MTGKEGPVAFLEVMEGNDRGRVFGLGGRRLSIGRSRQNPCQLLDDGVSRFHAYIEFDGQGHVIYDLGSTNGTFVLDERVSGRVLQDGDLIRIGNTILRYRCENRSRGETA